MKFLADRETRRQLLTLLVLAAAGGWLGFSLSWQAGCLVLALCCLFSLMTLRCTWRRYRSTEALCADLDRLLHGDSSVCLDAYTEGAWSLLHSQLTKLLIRLQEQASRSEQDKKKARCLSGRYLPSNPNAPDRLESSGDTAGRSIASGREAARDRPGAAAAAGTSGLAGGRLAAHVPAGRRHCGASPGASGFAPFNPTGGGALAVAMELCGQSFQILGQARFSGDAAWTVEALGNVLKNCVEHTPAGGSITAQLTENPIYSQILISDTGPGIAPEDLPHLFERFYRGKHATAQSVGIGLSLARMIITAQNGTIQASNRREGGAQFTIRFYKSVV